MLQRPGFGFISYCEMKSTGYFSPRIKLTIKRKEVPLFTNGYIHLYTHNLLYYYKAGGQESSVELLDDLRNERSFQTFLLSQFC